MAEVTISWTLTAIQQRNKILVYWNERNGNFIYSRKLNRLIKERIRLLKQNPDLGKPTNFSSTRILVMGHYSIIYKINLPHITISGFWDNRRDPAELLEILKKK